VAASEGAGGRREGEATRPRVTRLQILLGLVVALLVAVGFGLLVGRAAGFARLLSELRAANPAWLALCVAGQVTAYAGYTLSLREAVRFEAGPVMSPFATLRLILAALGATRIVAAGGAGGLAVVYWSLRQAGMGPRPAIVRVLAFNTLLYAVFGALGLAAAAAVLAGVGGDAPSGMALPWVVVVPACALAAAAVASPRTGGRLAADPVVGGWLRRAFSVAVAGVVTVRRLVASGRPGWLGGIGAVAYWAGDLTCLWAGVQSFGIEVSAAEIALVYTTGYVATLVPLPTGGVGGVDAAMTFALNATGVPLAQAVLGVMAYRLFNFWIPTVPALASLATLPRLGRHLRTSFRAEAAPEAGVAAVEPTGRR
jgi:hypothetical protein